MTQLRLHQYSNLEILDNLEVLRVTLKIPMALGFSLTLVFSVSEFLCHLEVFYNLEAHRCDLEVVGSPVDSSITTS